MNNEILLVTAEMGLGHLRALKPLEEKLEEKILVFGQTASSSKRERFIWKMSLRSYDVVILGHTHKLEAHKTYYLNSKKLYLNTGTCSMGRLQAVILNTETLKYDTIKLSSNDFARKSIRKAPKQPTLSISA